ncbi:MAG: NUDIX hydrolase [Caldilineae bacterium]|nr:MAG: NUDIX hydrolase [Caldilineae bacterium]
MNRRAGPEGGKTNNKTACSERTCHSAGGVAYRCIETPGAPKPQVQIALIATAGGRRWQLPKGRLRPGEHPRQAAVREVWEETGLRTVVESFLRCIEFTYLDTYRRRMPERVHKKVDIYLLRVVGGVLTDRSREVEGVRWCTPQEALERLTHPNEQDCIRRALHFWP